MANTREVKASNRIKVRQKEYDGIKRSLESIVSDCGGSFEDVSTGRSGKVKSTYRLHASQGFLMWHKSYSKPGSIKAMRGDCRRLLRELEIETDPQTIKMETRVVPTPPDIDQRLKDFYALFDEIALPDKKLLESQVERAGRAKGPQSRRDKRGAYPSITRQHRSRNR